MEEKWKKVGTRLEGEGKESEGEWKKSGRRLERVEGNWKER